MSEWVAYVDESGNRDGTVGGSDYFVLAGVAGSPSSLNELAERVRRLKLELAPRADPADWELHAWDIFHNRDGYLLGSLTLEEKMSVMRRIVDIVCDCDVVPFGATVLGKRMRKNGASAAKITEQTMARLVERLEQLVQGLEDETTLVIISDITYKKYRLAMERALSRRVTGRVKMSPGKKRRVTHIKFVDSRSSALVQVADAIAYIIHRHIGGDAMFDELFRDIKHKSRFRRGQRSIRMRSERRVG